MIPQLDAGLQNGADYQIYILKDDGTRLASFKRGPGGRQGPLDNSGFNVPIGGQITEQATANQVVSFSYTEVLNNIGRFSLKLPGSFDRRILRKDNRVVIWRKPPGGARKLAFMGFIRKPATRTDANGNTTREAAGYDLNYLLSGRVVAYYAGHARAEQSDQADDLMKSFVDENLGAAALSGSGRKVTAAISSTYFSVEADAALGVSQTKAASYRKVLDVLREIADAARTDGTEVNFKVVPTDIDSFQFQTRTGQWGRDRTAGSGSGLVFSLTRGNLAGPIELLEDATDEINRAFALGQGEGANREIQYAEDTARINASLFAVREGKIDARQFSTAAGVLDAANSLLIKGRPVNTFTARLLSVAGSVYGKDWGFGDRITIDYDDRQFDALVRAVTVSVDENGAETLDTTLEAYGL